MMYQKKCITCSSEFLVPSWRVNKAKYCAKTCQRQSKAAKIATSKRFKGKPKSDEWKRKASLCKMGAKNPMWKGDRAGLDAIHIWVLRRKPKPKYCEICKNTPPKDLANISQRYERDVNDFEWLCRRCHMEKDGRLEVFQKLNKK